MKKPSLVILGVISAGCASVSTDVVLTHEGVPQGELLVYREPAFLAGGAALYFGEGDKYFFVLNTEEYAKVKIDAGEHIFQAKAHASPAFELKVNVEPNTVTCLKGRPNSAVAGMVAIPILGHTLNTFVLEKVDCPVGDHPAGYSLAKKP